MKKKIISKVLGVVMGILPFYLFALLPLPVLAGNVKSPNGNIELKFTLDGTGRPVYEMTYKGKAVINPSHLGLELAKDKHASKGMQETDLMDGFTIVKEETSETDETWQPVWGETKDIRNHYNEYTAVLRQSTQSARSSSASVSTTTASGSVMSFPSRKR